MKPCNSYKIKFCLCRWAQMSAVCGLLVILLAGCNPEIRPIQYGRDLCTYCKMTIMDPKFGAEMVTEKGKIYMFDAIECMVNFSRQTDQAIRYYAVNTMDQPTALYEVEKCVFIVNPAIPSPMGANLSAYLDRQSQHCIQAAAGGTVYDWSELPEALHQEPGKSSTSK